MKMSARQLQKARKKHSGSHYEMRIRMQLQDYLKLRKIKLKWKKPMFWFTLVGFGMFWYFWYLIFDTYRMAGVENAENSSSLVIIEIFTMVLININSHQIYNKYVVSQIYEIMSYANVRIWITVKFNIYYHCSKVYFTKSNFSHYNFNLFD